MKKIFAILLTAVLALAGAVPAQAYSNSVSWVGNGGYVDASGNMYASDQQCTANGNYLLWIMTAKSATNADIDFDGPGGNAPVAMQQKSKGSFRYVQSFDEYLPYSGSVVATYDGPSGGKVNLVISHGCNYFAPTSMTVTKALSGAPNIYPGGLINYTITATNDGETTLTNVAISDANATIGTCTPAAPATLQPGESITCSASHTITLAEMTNIDETHGEVRNTARATSDQINKDSNEIVVPIEPQPNVSITKTQTSGAVTKAGDVIRYSITAQNTGNLPLTNVRIADANAIIGTCTPVQGSTLAIGGSMTCTATHTVTNADVNAAEVLNVATVSSNEKNGTSNEVKTPIGGLVAGISITKSLTGNLPAKVGDTITYLLVATNTGTMELNNVVIADANASIQVCSITAPVNLSPGGSLTCAATHVVTQADVDAGEVRNTATVSSTQKGATSNEVVVPLPKNPSLTVIKSVTGDLPKAEGDVITFVVEVTNSGNESLSNVTVSDTNAVLDSCTPSNPADLTPGAKITCTYKHTVTTADIDACQVVNVATASSGETSATSNQVVVPIDCTPVLSITKELVGVKPNVAGDIITYRINVTNSGEKKLTGVIVTDDNATLESCTPSTPATLEVGEIITCTATHVVTEADVTRGYVDNVAKVKSGNLTVTSDLVRVPLYSTPALGISKRVTGTAAQKTGDKIQYIIVATNTGNVDLTNVTVSDDNAVITSCDKPNPVPQLAIGASITCQAYHTVTKADVAAGEVINVAVATASENVIATSGAGSGFSAGENGDVKSNQVITKLKATSASGTNNTSTPPKKPKIKKLAFTGGEGPIGHDANDLLLTLVLLTLIGLAVRRRIAN